MTEDEIEAELAKIDPKFSLGRIRFLMDQGWDNHRIAERLKVPYQKVRNHRIVREHRAAQKSKD